MLIDGEVNGIVTIALSTAVVVVEAIHWNNSP
jgi:hypothetical protein